MKMFLFILYLGYTSHAIAQYQKIDARRLEGIRTKTEQYYDDTISSALPLGITHLFIKFKDVYIDLARKKIFISGQVCQEKERCYPRCGVQIFKGVRKNSYLQDRISLLTIPCPDQPGKEERSGDFDIVFPFSMDEKLYFFADGFYLEEFDIGLLFSKSNCKAPRKN